MLHSGRKHTRASDALSTIAGFVALRDMTGSTQEPTIASLFTDQEVDRLRMAYDTHANSNDGNLLCKDLPDLLKALFIVPTKLELASLVSQMDPNGTGTVDFPSFSVAITNFLKPQYDRAMLDKAFYEISGGRSEIDSDSLRRVMLRLGQINIRREDCDAMIREIDRTGDGYISIGDFHHMQTHTLNDEAP